MKIKLLHRKNGKIVTSKWDGTISILKYGSSGLTEEKKKKIFTKATDMVISGGDEIFATMQDGVVKILDTDLDEKAELGYNSVGDGVRCLDTDHRFVAIGHHKGGVTVLDRERPDHKHVMKYFKSSCTVT